MTMHNSIRFDLKVSDCTIHRTDCVVEWLLYNKKESLDSSLNDI